jgi:hypothetical protein
MPFRERRLEPPFNVAPTQFLKLTRRHPTESVRRLSLMRWGLIRKLKLRLRQVKRLLGWRTSLHYCEDHQYQQFSILDCWYLIRTRVCQR